MAAPLVYLDSSVALRTILDTPGRQRLQSWMQTPGATFISSRLLRTEVIRVLRRDGRPLVDGTPLLDRVGLLEITRETHTVAESIERLVRTLGDDAPRRAADEETCRAHLSLARVGRLRGCAGACWLSPPREERQGCAPDTTLCTRCKGWSHARMALHIVGASPGRRGTRAWRRTTTPTDRAGPQHAEGSSGSRLSAPGGIRTPSLLIRSQMLYPLSYGRNEVPAYTERWGPTKSPSMPHPPA